MSWLRLDDSVATHPKLLELSRADRWRWLELLTLAARYRTAGAVTPGMLRTADIHDRLTRALLELRLLEPDPTAGAEPGELRIHDWHEYNPQRDPTNRERQRRYRARQRAQTVPADAHAIESKATPSAETAREHTSGLETERNALRDALPVTVAPLPPVPVPVTTPPQPPRGAPPATPRARRRSSGGRAEPDARIAGDVAEELERLRELADDPPSWGAGTAEWGSEEPAA